MEISTLKSGEREALLDLVDLWQLPDGWRGRDFFRRYIEQDSSFADKNFWVARDEGKPVSCVQIFPRSIRMLGHAIPTGGIGTVFTHPDHRGKGLASQLLGRATAAMRESGMELSVLFSGLHDFYGNWGWRAQKMERSLVQRKEDAAAPVSEDQPGTELEIAAFDRANDLEAVKALHWSYSAPRHGTVIRDAGLWDASLVLAGNPNEEFLVARRDGTPVAYVRATLLSSTLCVTELGRSEDAPGPQARLIASLLEPRDPDPLAPPKTASRELRSAVLLPSFDDIALAVALEHRGLSMHAIEDKRFMLRCLDVDALAKRMGVRLLPGEDGDAFIDRVLPLDNLTFWPADRI